MTINKIQIDFELAYQYFEFTAPDASVFFKEILKLICTKKGSFYTYLPTCIPQEKHRWFITDILNQSDKVDFQKDIVLLREQLINTLKNHLIKPSNKKIIFEEINFNETNISDVMFNIARSTYDLFGVIHEDNIFYRFDKPNDLNKLYEYVLLQNPFIAYLSEYKGSNKNTLENIQLEEIKEKIERVVVSAYCDLGYLIWENDSK